VQVLVDELSSGEQFDPAPLVGLKGNDYMKRLTELVLEWANSAGLESNVRFSGKTS